MNKTAVVLFFFVSPAVFWDDQEYINGARTSQNLCEPCRFNLTMLDKDLLIPG
jgi:hypothetical protein